MLTCRYFIMKSQILESMGFTPKERFPVFADRMPNQLLAYIRLSRVQDPALFAKVGSRVTSGHPSEPNRSRPAEILHLRLRSRLSKIL